MNATYKHHLTWIITLAITALLAFQGCSSTDIDSIAGPTDAPGIENGEVSFAKKKDKTGTASQVNWPITASGTFRYNRGLDTYRGGTIKFGGGNKSKLSLAENALTPPPGVNWGEDITITMTIDYDEQTNELHFEFGPHGCLFTPRVEIKMDFAAMGLAVPNLYYHDENGNRVPQQPDQISVNKKWLKIRLDHFSRYSLSHS